MQQELSILKRWTWEDLQETAKKLTNKEKKITGFAFPGKRDL